jgi:alkanesulfonate monooxygenase SsuD/methylene tetrahydromethanopterin reductase-like flavin-dependent oxidoreductase (luciferase family)
LLDFAEMAKRSEGIVQMKFGLKLPLFAASDLGRTFSYSDLRDIAQQIEAEGFDSLWLMDHLLFRWDEQKTQGVWEAWTLLSALAEATQQIELGSLVLCNQFRNPAILAKMAVTLDEVSTGRFILGLGAGWHRPEFDAFGMPFDHRVSRLEEALKIIRPLLKEGYVDFSGSYYQARHCELLPRGPRRTGPPILQTCGI